MSVPLRAVFLGFGSVGKACAELLLRGHPSNLCVVGVSDARGGTLSAEGLNLQELLQHKAGGESVKTFAGGSPVADSAALVRQCSESCRADVVVDLSPVNLESGDPGLSAVRMALERGVSAVLANKAPLVLDYAGLEKLRAAQDLHLEFSATVCGGLPVINVGRRDLVGATVEVEGIFNSTTNYILHQMEQGHDRSAALADAQRRGIAEADPSLDIDGFDTANKLVIICNSVLGIPARLNHVALTGIGGVTSDAMEAAKGRGCVIRLVARAVKSSEANGLGFELSVRPEEVLQTSFLGSCVESDMCCRFRTDIFENIEMKTDEKGVYPTAAAVLRDCFTIWGARSRGASKC